MIKALIFLSTLIVGIIFYKAAIILLFILAFLMLLSDPWDDIYYVSGSSQQEVDMERCERCAKTEDVTFAPNPYQVNMHDDKTPVYLCGECREDIVGDI